MVIAGPWRRSHLKLAKRLRRTPQGLKMGRIMPVPSKNLFLNPKSQKKRRLLPKPHQEEKCLPLLLQSLQRWPSKFNQASQRPDEEFNLQSRICWTCRVTILCDGSKSCYQENWQLRHVVYLKWAFNKKIQSMHWKSFLDLLINLQTIAVGTYASASLRHFKGILHMRLAFDCILLRASPS